jgi:CBS domain-containing protein
VAQVVTAPVLAAAASSPMFLGRRLWNETRVALFEHSVDSRRDAHHERSIKPRVIFGDEWVSDSILELFREQVARFRVMLPDVTGEDPMKMLERGDVPPLKALSLHNGTIYRWNRACYGITNGVPHLRIENRALPAGPTVADEVANAAFYYGLMAGFSHQVSAVHERLAFASVKENFMAAARSGLKAQLTWVDGTTHPARELILAELVPLARSGLIDSGIDSADIDEYLGIVEERVRVGRNGARWMLDSYEALGDTPPESRDRALVSACLRYGEGGTPVHTWPLCEPPREEHVRDAYRTVGQFMTTDLFTVRPEDLLDLAASVMDWKHIEHIPVEDDEGRLVGIITYRMLLRLVARGRLHAGEEVLVSDIMREDPHTVSPDTPTLEAMRVMRKHRVGCLPVVADDKLVGIITQSDLIDVSAGLLEKYLNGE